MWPQINHPLQMRERTKRSHCCKQLKLDGSASSDADGTIASIAGENSGAAVTITTATLQHLLFPVWQRASILSN